MKKYITNRGFTGYDFEDIYKTPCKLYESSSADKPHIWLSNLYDTPIHIDKKLAKKLIEKLTLFVKAGHL